MIRFLPRNLSEKWNTRGCRRNTWVHWCSSYYSHCINPRTRSCWFNKIYNNDVIWIPTSNIERIFLSDTPRLVCGSWRDLCSIFRRRDTTTVDPPRVNALSRPLVFPLHGARVDTAEWVNGPRFSLARKGAVRILISLWRTQWPVLSAIAANDSAESLPRFISICIVKERERVHYLMSLT